MEKEIQIPETVAITFILNQLKARLIKHPRSVTGPTFTFVSSVPPVLKLRVRIKELQNQIPL